MAFPSIHPRPMEDPIPTNASGADRATTDIALVVPVSGPAGMFGPSCEINAELAVVDIDASGGILDRPLRLHTVDAGAPLGQLSDTIDRLVTLGQVDAVVGWHLSDARRVMAPLTAGRVPYIYTTFYEGGEQRDGVYMVGETPEQQLFPALRWLREHCGVRRWCVVGNDYIWPQQTAAMTRAFCDANGFDYAGEAFVPLRSRNFGHALSLIRQTQPDGVLVLMVGADNAAFNRAFARAHLDERHIRLSMMIGEDVLYASGPQATHGLFTSCGYFESLVTPTSLSFGARYENRFGASAPALNNIGESCYEGLMLLASLAGAASSLRVPDIRRASSGVAYWGPRGEVQMRGSHTHQPVFLAEAQRLEFEVLTELTES
jgi:urea transport system substrate-binding protein